MVELDAPLGVAGLVAPDLRDAHHQHRAHEDQEVEDEEEEHLDQQRQVVLEGLEVVPEREERPGPGDVRSRSRLPELDQVDDRDQPAEPDHEPFDEPAPCPGTAPVDDVLLTELRVVGAEEARPGQDLADEEVDQAAEDHDDEEGHEDRLADAPAIVVVEPVVDGGARQDRDERREAGEPPQFPRKKRVGFSERVRAAR